MIIMYTEGFCTLHSLSCCCNIVTTSPSITLYHTMNRAFLIRKALKTWGLGTPRMYYSICIIMSCMQAAARSVNESWQDKIFGKF